MKTCEFGQDNPRRIALFGGTFNPIHRGHLQVALDVLQQVHLDRIYFIPSAVPPHKSTGQLATAQERLDMVGLALEGHERLMACDVEIKRTGPSYSIDTVRQFKQTAGQVNRLFFMVGVDAFLEIHTWRAADRLFEETAFIVMSRAGSGQWSPQMRRQVEKYVQDHVSTEYALSAGEAYLAHPRLQKIHLVTVTPVDVASSNLRRMRREGQTIAPWVAPAVARYIEQRGLYQ
ncbi:MAG: nicotinate-nucleotide adenylyltransferase [Desulfatitalea sp.]